jgi:hypothetical protein
LDFSSAPPPVPGAEMMGGSGAFSDGGGRLVLFLPVGDPKVGIASVGTRQSCSGFKRVSEFAFALCDGDGDFKGVIGIPETVRGGEIGSNS